MENKFYDRLLTIILAAIGFIVFIYDTDHDSGKSEHIQETTISATTVAEAQLTNLSFIPHTTSSTNQTTETTTLTTTSTTHTTTTILSPEDQAFLEYRQKSLEQLEGKTMLEGIDISVYQSGDDWKHHIDEADAVIMRFSCGSDIDTMFYEYMDYAKSKSKLIGMYFYTNQISWRTRDPVEYADWCIENTKDYLGYAVYALDCEIDDGSPRILDSEWILAFLRRFKEVTGTRPVLYTYQSLLNNSGDQEALSTIRAESYGLWIANYGQNDGTVKSFDVVAWEENMVFGHQYVSAVEHLDRDIFYCRPEAWYKFAKTNSTPS